VDVYLPHKKQFSRYKHESSDNNVRATNNPLMMQLQHIFDYNNILIVISDKAHVKAADNKWEMFVF